MAFDEDFSEFTGLDDFGVTAIVGGISVQGIFDNEAVDAVADITAPVFSYAIEDVEPVRGMTVVVNSANYVIRSVRPDGTGWVEVDLEL